jgi:hypothetical protein
MATPFEQLELSISLPPASGAAIRQRSARLRSRRSTATLRTEIATGASERGVTSIAMMIRSELIGLGQETGIRASLRLRVR